VREGVAWISAYPAPRFASIGYCWVESAPAERRSVGAVLAAHPATYWVEAIDGGAAYFAGIVGRSPRDLDATVAAIGAHPGVTAVRLQLCRSILHDGTRWTPPDPRAVRDHGDDGLVWRAEESAPGAVLAPADLELYRALVVDGRASFLELATRTGLSDRTIRRRLAMLLDDGALHTRCDVARDVVGLEVGFFLSVAWTPGWRRLVSAAARTTGARLVAGVTGDAPFLLHFWGRSAADVDRVVGRLERACPDLPLLRIDLATRPVKRFGRIFGPDGRVAGLVGDHVANDVFSHVAG
jgi:DNA-binding Lrp family transcriptional regulator